MRINICFTGNNRLFQQDSKCGKNKPYNLVASKKNFDTVFFLSSILDKITGVEIGKANLVEEKTDRKIRAIVTYQEITEGTRIKKHVYRIYSPSKKLLGYMRLGDSSQYDEHLYNHGFNTDYLHVSFIDTINNGDYQGIGKSLIQIAVEKSIKMGYKGRLKVTADNISNSKLRQFNKNGGCPTGFYYEQCGFRSDPDEYFTDTNAKENDAKIEKELQQLRKEGKNPNLAKLNWTKMYLPEETIKDFWCSKIKDNSILN
jgi:hypothetical protein